jgi:tetratricopeptide (TPR) repeat protein
MPDNPRIEDLRRRVEKDPASIAFAQLAEEYRRAGHCKEAVAVCRTGLALHAGYLSARVTMGRALLELGQLEEAQKELETVLKSAAENLAAIRGLAEIHHRRGALDEALRHYRSALALARNDPELEETVKDLERQVEPATPPPAANGLSLDEMHRELKARLPLARPAPNKLEGPAPREAEAPAPSKVEGPAPRKVEALVPRKVEALVPNAVEGAPSAVEAPLAAVSPSAARVPEAPSGRPRETRDTAPDARVKQPEAVDPERDRALRTVAALEEFLAAVDVARANRRA